MSRPRAKVAVAASLVVVASLAAGVFLDAGHPVSLCEAEALESYEVKRLTIGDQPHFLYAHVSGWHDKAYYYSLYDADPRIDACGVPQRRPVHSEHVAEDEIPRAVVIRNNGIHLIYRTPKEVEEAPATQVSGYSSIYLQNVAVELKDVR